ncbi:major facilitator superfamily transporter [Seiridium cupressi]
MISPPEKDFAISTRDPEHEGGMNAVDVVHIPGYDADLQIQSGETRKALLKVDFFILPFIVLCFCLLQFDRTNIGNALTDTLGEDINVTNAEINLAQILFTVGFIVTELPFNIISKYIGPERFLPVTIAATPKTFLGRSFTIFTDREASILVTRVIHNDPTKNFHSRQSVQFSHIVEAFTDWRLYGHLVAAFLCMIMIAPMNTYAPSIIKSLGFSTLQANGLNSVGSVCALVWSVSLAFSSDKLRERGFHIALGYLWGAAGLLWLALAPVSSSRWTLYGGVVWTQMGMGSAQAISAAWLTSKVQDHKRPVALAAYVMSIQLANFPGNQLFTTGDAPRYTHGLSIAAGCAIAAAVVILVWKLLYYMFDHGDNGSAKEIGPSNAS